MKIDNECWLRITAQCNRLFSGHPANGCWSVFQFGSPVPSPVSVFVSNFQLHMYCVVVSDKEIMETACTLCDFLLPIDAIETNNFPTLKDAKMHAHIHVIQSKYVHTGITEDDMLNKCFPKLSFTERPGLKTAKECRRALNEVCRSIFAKEPKIARAACNLCGIEVGLFCKKDNLKHEYFEATRIIDHSCNHLDEKPFVCCHCNDTFGGRSSVMTHLSWSHKIVPTAGKDFVCLYEKLHNEIVIAIQRCFSRCPEEVQPRKIPHRLSLMRLCRSMFNIKPEVARAICNVCDAGVHVRSVERGKHIDTSSIIIHACHHLGIKIFKCQYCDKMADRECVITKHLQLVHGVMEPTRNDDVEDMAERFGSKISDEIKRCFSDCKQAVVSKEARKGIRSEVSIRACTNASELGTQRLLFFNQLIRDLIDSNGKIECRLCSKRTTAKPASGLNGLLVLTHVYRHMKKPLYKCNVCSKHFFTYSATAQHLRGVHALRMGVNHKCFDDDFHAEIMGMASKCFAQEPSGAD